MDHGVVSVKGYVAGGDGPGGIHEAGPVGPSPEGGRLRRKLGWALGEAEQPCSLKEGLRQAHGECWG